VALYLAGAVTLYLFLVPAGALILLVTLVSLLQIYQPKLLPGMVQPLDIKEPFLLFYLMDWFTLTEYFLEGLLN
jgi:hypothetical protein